jgi:hypothetical protein
MVRESHETYLWFAPNTTPYVRQNDEYMWRDFTIGKNGPRNYNLEQLLDRGNELLNKEHQLKLLDNQRKL